MEFLELSTVYGKLESTTKRIEKTKIIADFLKDCSNADIEKIVLLLQGIVFPKYEDQKIGIASKLVVKALSTASGITTDEIEKVWKKTGDLGETACDIIKRKKQHTLFSSDLTIDKVYTTIRKLASVEGIGSTDLKLKMISELLTSARADEAKYITRLLLEDLRVGLGEGTLRDAIAWGYQEKSTGTLIDAENETSLFGKDTELAILRDKIQQAYDITNDYAQIAQIVFESGLEKLELLKLDPLKPVKVMLAQKVKDLPEGFERVGTPAALEYKYDGFRMLIGRLGDEVSIHTRRLENVTGQFPEVAAYVKTHIASTSFIIDSEAVGFDPKTGKYVPFQQISQRIKRKYDIEKVAREIPVELNVFDILFFEGESWITKPYEERRALIERLIKEEPQHIMLAKQMVTSSVEEGTAFYQKSLDAGNEGIMLKTLNAPYKPGSRVGYMVKMKPIMETLDLVIVGGEWGEGKRSGWISSFILAVYDPDTDEFLEIGKFGTGVKEKSEEGTSFDELTQLLKPHITHEKGREISIVPHVVVEIKFEEIQKSPSYSSGYALRFPRLVRIRPDRKPDSCSTIGQVEDMYREQ